MKESNFFISFLIPGLRSSGREIDVYLQPLIEELKELWNFGVRTYDSLTSQFFQLYAILFGQLMTFRHMVTYSGGLQRGIKHVPYTWEIDRHSGYKGKYLSWNIDVIFQRTMFSV